jgi:hypothetical protein
VTARRRATPQDVGASLADILRYADRTGREINVFCEDPAHVGPRWVQDFVEVRNPSSPEFRWMPKRVHRSADAVILTSEDASAPRMRYTLWCKECKKVDKERNVPATTERLLPVLDALAHVGVSSISLAGLAASLSRSQGLQ